MKRRMLIATLVAVLMLTILSHANAGEIRCAECGMMVMMDSKFTSRITQGDTVQYFCDIGDLFTYLKKKNPQNAGIEVRDYISGEWIDARKAFYVNAGKKFSTPMGWGIAAFKNKNDGAQSGSVADFEAMTKSLK